MIAENKIKIYKKTVRPILQYAAETRAHMKEPKQKISNVEIKTLRTVTCRTLRDRKTNKNTQMDEEKK